MKVKINSYIVGFSQPPGTVLTVGEDITEGQATMLLGMGKEAELVPEDPADSQKVGAVVSTEKAEPAQDQGPWFRLPGVGQKENDNPPVGEAGKKSAAGSKGSKSAQAAS